MSGPSRLLAGVEAGKPLTLGAHLAIHGPRPRGGPPLLDEVERSGLGGRGGARFPTATKMRTVAAAGGRRRTVLVNAAEGEPMSAKDRVLLRLAPHLVIDGAIAAAEAVGADTIVFAVAADAVRSSSTLQWALGERRDLGAVRVRIEAVPPLHLAGEETALIRYLDGGELKPALVPPLPAERGLRRGPTLVQNPETLAHVALIARHGGAWFREVGTPEHPGTALLTVGGAVHAPGVQEIACGTPLATVIERSGGTREPVRAVLIGGYHGTWIDNAVLGSVALDDRALAAHGATLGAGVVTVLAASDCGVREVARVMAWLAGQGAGQCGPCANGLPAIAAAVTALADGRAPRDGRAQLDRWSRQIAGRGACRLPDGAVRFLRSGRRVFAEEFAAHERGGACRACRRPGPLRFPGPYRVAA